MSTLAYQLFQQLRHFTVSDGRDRETRAVFVAQSMAYQHDLDLSTTAEDNIKDALVGFRELLGKLNEYLSVDVKLSQRVFEAMVRTRWDVATSHHDETLMLHILRSDTQLGHLSPELGEFLKGIVATKEYKNHQQRGKAILEAHRTEAG